LDYANNESATTSPSKLASMDLLEYSSPSPSLALAL
jgi:hypothetical protein